jgi:hypothetical protein
MSMQTTIMVKEAKYRFITQQYEIGLYVALYRDGVAVPDQMTSKLSEIKFHKKIRKGEEWIPEESTPIQ